MDARVRGAGFQVDRGRVDGGRWSVEGGECRQEGLSVTVRAS